MKGVREKKMGETRSLEKWVFVHEYRGSDKQKRMIKENVWLFLEEGTSWGIFFFFFLTSLVRLFSINESKKF